MAKIESTAPYLAPVRKSVTVATAPDATFELFTGGIAAWWPMERYSVSQARTREVVIEPGTGGRVYEVRDDGETFPWGRVLAWDPPARLVLSWHPGREPDVAQEVELRFTAVAGGTRVELEHRNWQALGDAADNVRERYANGWVEVLGRCFVAACTASHGAGESRR